VRGTRPAGRTGHLNGAHTVGGEEAIWCGWHDCERRGLLLYEVRIEYGANPAIYSHLVRQLFCSERHRQLFMNGHRSYGNLPTGERGRLL